MHEKEDTYLLDDLVCMEALVAACHPLLSALLEGCSRFRPGRNRSGHKEAATPFARLSSFQIATGWVEFQTNVASVRCFPIH